MLHSLEEYEKRKRYRDPYDVQWLVRPNEKKICPWEEEDFVNAPEPQRSDAEIIAFALRRQTKPKYFTNDLAIKVNLIEDLSLGNNYHKLLAKRMLEKLVKNCRFKKQYLLCNFLGLPKVKLTLATPPEVAISRAAPRSAGADSKKTKGNEKDTKAEKNKKKK